MNPLIRKLFYTLPVGLRYTVRRLYYLPADLLTKRHELVPPKGMIFTGMGDYVRVGEQTFAHFLKYGNITPESTVLDIGSGIGRMAVPFTGFLTGKGRYEGFDIVKMGVDWCKEYISARYANFNFRHIDLRNDLYNLKTKDTAAEFIFPYPDNNFDFVFLTSVFTHMMPRDMEHYISEIKRVMKPGSRCYATFFILDKESEDAMYNSGGKFFPYKYGTYSLMDKNVKEANIAYQKDYIFGLLEGQGLQTVDFFRGFWSGLPAGGLNEHQDVIIFEKK